MPGRTIAIGDIHGCAVAFDTLLQAIAPARADTLITLGDYVDRGPNSSDVIEILNNLLPACNLVPLVGNHELMMMQALESRNSFEMWMQCGGDATLASYGNRLSNLPQHHRLFLNHCLQFYETPTHFFVHANYDPVLPLAQQPVELCLWTHIVEHVPPPHSNGKIAIVGHTPQMDGEIRDLGHVKIIDTHCYGGQWLTALDVDSGQVWQATNEGQLRETHLAPA